MLEDLIVAALNDAVKQVAATSKARMSGFSCRPESAARHESAVLRSGLAILNLSIAVFLNLAWDENTIQSGRR